MDVASERAFPALGLRDADYDPRVSSPSIVWFRDDLRLADNPALRAAIDRGEPIIGLYVLDEESDGIRPSAEPRSGGWTEAFARSPTG